MATPIGGAGGGNPFRVVQGGLQAHTARGPGVAASLLPEDDPAVRMAVRRAAGRHANVSGAVPDMVRAILPHASDREVEFVSQAILGSSLMGSAEAVFHNSPRSI